MSPPSASPGRCGAKLLPLPVLDVFCFEPPIELDYDLCFEGGVVGVAVIGRGAALYFCFPTRAEPLNLPRRQSAPLVADIIIVRLTLKHDVGYIVYKQ
jgi:hypothetical protein